MQRSLVPVTRSPLPTIHRGTTVTRRLLATRGSLPEHRPGFGLAVASTLGLSLAAYYAAVVDPLHADPPPGREHETKVQASINEDIRALRSRKSVNSFASGTAKDTEGLLKRYEESHVPSSTSGVARYDIAQLASNDPLEDDHSEAFVNSGDSRWSFFTVLDGHSGWETSAVLREELIDTVITELADATPENAETSSDPFADAVTRAFKKLDDKIVHKNVEQALQSNSRSVAINLLAPAYAGACALLAFYDANNSKLRVALTGDCRAIMGRKRRDGRYDLEVLTTDQTGFNPDEKKRVEAAHPGEAVVNDGRTMGFGPSRVFGDARWKWSREVQDKLKRSYLGRTVLDSIKTPPYFTAEPVIKTTNVQPGDFLVLATDGLWECLTNQEVVGLVGRWVQQQEGKRTPWQDWWWGRRDKGEDGLPVICNKETETDEKSVRYRQWRAEKKFATVDLNAATHLIRNAVGGADEDLREALLSMRSPRARSYWDDITATVVFFGQE